jgi:hypothetical protein
MIVYLDFDGTVVEYDFPRVGRCNFGCIEVIDKIQKAGHTVVLNTARCEGEDPKYMQQAIDWFQYAWMLVKDREDIGVDADFELLPIEATKTKIQPCKWDLSNIYEQGYLMIDDNAYGMPLKPSCMVSRPMVDWDEVDRQLERINFYKTQQP